jgi:hypothetical protein
MIFTKPAAIGIFATSTQAEVAVDMLITRGFPSKGISVLLPERPNNQPATEHTGTASSIGPQTTKTETVSVVGATAGGALIGALGLLVGAGALAIPGLGPLIAAGPIMAGLAGLGVGGAAGGIAGALVGMGLPDDEAQRFTTGVGEGRTLVIVNCDAPEKLTDAMATLRAAGAADVSSSSGGAKAA